ncbi:MAG: 2-oxoacid:acceptor oxidoreductase subunit alpha [Myxococcales bacterium]|nr:MAG: 2-oxoacid:acceptor oxidoreductase subunit alpha [Myxococcales bacterium]
MQNLTLRIGGEGGEGVISCGEILTSAAASAGYHIFTFRTYPAEIRGGLAMFQLRVGDEPVLSAGDKLDLFVAFNQEAIDNYLPEVLPGGIVLYDPAQCRDLAPLGRRKRYEAPLNDICRRVTDATRAKNIVAVGVLAWLLGMPDDVVGQRVRKQFAKKGETVVSNNMLALNAGYAFARDELKSKPLAAPPARKTVKPAPERLILSGNEAAALGALAAGVRFCAGYPITPATPIFETLARQLPRFNGHLIQCEDEIAAIGACLGASYAGQKALTTTSGPGMALMGEFISLAAMAELPVLIIDVQRSGPSTGMPTKTEQGDLNFAVYGTPGDAPRVVLAPATVEECFDLTVLAVNIAERYQTPVILLSDASLAYRTETTRRFDLESVEIWPRQEWDPQTGEAFQRYAFTKTGVSPITTPGTEHGYYQATGLEHDEYGHPSYTPHYHEEMLRKRHQKLAKLEQELAQIAYVQSRPSKAKFGVVSWGSTRGAAAEAIRMAAGDGIPIAHFHPRLLHPLPKAALRGFLKKMEKVVVIEENFSGQLANMLRGEFSMECASLTKYQGIPFMPQEIYKALRQMAKR